ncbi:MAG: hypothetical protein ABJB12_13400 [Pseudomonadota bacterium]
MNNDESKKSALEGEGSYSATRNYNRHLAEASESGDVEAAAEAARRAVEGPEGEELARAAEEAKKGPRPPAPSAAKHDK